MCVSQSINKSNGAILVCLKEEVAYSTQKDLWRDEEEMRKLIYIISAVLFLVFASGVNAGSCWNYDVADCKVKAEQGNALAQFNVGWMYGNEKGVPLDDKKAVYCYSKVAEQGFSKAQQNLGVMYDNRKGVYRATTYNAGRILGYGFSLALLFAVGGRVILRL